MQPDILPQKTAKLFFFFFIPCMTLYCLFRNNLVQWCPLHWTGWLRCLGFWSSHQYLIKWGLRSYLTKPANLQTTELQIPTKNSLWFRTFQFQPWAILRSILLCYFICILLIRWSVSVINQIHCNIHLTCINHSIALYKIAWLRRY